MQSALTSAIAHILVQKIFAGSRLGRRPCTQSRQTDRMWRKEQIESKKVRWSCAYQVLALQKIKWQGLQWAPESQLRWRPFLPITKSKNMLTLIGVHRSSARAGCKSKWCSTEESKPPEIGQTKRRRECGYSQNYFRASHFQWIPSIEVQIWEMSAFLE